MNQIKVINDLLEQSTIFVLLCLIFNGWRDRWMDTTGNGCEMVEWINNLPGDCWALLSRRVVTTLSRNVIAILLLLLIGDAGTLLPGNRFTNFSWNCCALKPRNFSTLLAWNSLTLGFGNLSGDFGTLLFGNIGANFLLNLSWNTFAVLAWNLKWKNILTWTWIKFFTHSILQFDNLVLEHLNIALWERSCSFDGVLAQAHSRISLWELVDSLA